VAVEASAAEASVVGSAVLVVIAAVVPVSPAERVRVTSALPTARAGANCQRNLLRGFAAWVSPPAHPTA